MSTKLLPATHAPATALQRRLEGYWRLEGFNVLLVPAIALYLAWPPQGAGAIALLLTLVTNALLLLAGAAYWRASLRRLRGDAATMRALLPRLDRAQRPILLLVFASGIATVAAALVDGWTTSVIVATGAAVLAALEYINYYRVQLQHFDHAPDFARLLRGRGWRAAHMGRDLAAWRRGR